MKVIPNQDNANIGFSYTVTDEQIKRHQSLSLEEIFNWIEESANFIYELQTDEERERKYVFKPAKRPIHFTEEEQRQFWEDVKNLKD